MTCPTPVAYTSGAQKLIRAQKPAGGRNAGNGPSNCVNTPGDVPR